MARRNDDFTSAEIKAGITVAAALAALLLFTAVIYGLRPAERTKAFYSDFKDTGGLNRGADVRFGGLKVGRVADIAPVPGDWSRIRISWAVREDTPVNEASVASISQISLVTDKHLEISTGDGRSPLVSPGTAVPARGGGSGMFDAITVIAEDVHRVLSDDGALGDLRRLLGARGEEAATRVVSVADLLASADRAVVEGKGFIEELRAAVSEGRKDLDGILGKLDALGDGARGVLGRIDEIVAENRDDIRGSIAGAREAIDRAGKLAGSLGDELGKAVAAAEKVLGDAGALSADARTVVEENRPALEDALRDLKDLMRNLKRFSQTVADRPDALLLGAPPAGRR